MIISRTPLRTSFVGGGSDLAAFYRHEPGGVVSTAIDKYIYITINRKFDSKIRVSYSETEIVDSVDELKHDLVRESLKLLGVDGGIEITSIADVPSNGTGLGSSSSYTVGLLNALYAYKNTPVEAGWLAKEACQIEIECCSKPIGKQDQYIAAYGGLQHIQFNPDETVSVDQITLSGDVKKRLEQRLLLFYTGLARSSEDILTEQRKNTEQQEDKRKTLHNMVKLASELNDALMKDDLDSFGELLHAGWLEKRKMASNITSSTIDEWYETARKHGTIGGKILGAGGGGFLLLYAPKEKHDDIVKALPQLRPFPFKFEPQGSKIVYADNNGRYKT
jgi:D-glycero-alpha-D-manno-heptose-7-phosphate kinase